MEGWFHYLSITGSALGAMIIMLFCRISAPSFAEASAVAKAMADKMEGGFDLRFAIHSTLLRTGLLGVNKLILDKIPKNSIIGRQ